MKSVNSASKITLSSRCLLEVEEHRPEAVVAEDYQLQEHHSSGTRLLILVVHQVLLERHCRVQVEHPCFAEEGRPSLNRRILNLGKRHSHCNSIARLAEGGLVVAMERHLQGGQGEHCILQPAGRKRIPRHHARQQLRQQPKEERNRHREVDSRCGDHDHLDHVAAMERPHQSAHAAKA